MRPLRPLRVHVFQHVPFEGLGCMHSWLESRGHRLGFSRPFEGGAADVSSAANADWIIVMGGPMGVHDGDRFPWLREEKRVLENAVKRGAAILGVCLGAQLLADVLGAPVKRNREPEIGWFPVDLGKEAISTWLGGAFPARFTPFHWHGDTFAIPSGAIALGSSQACDHQGFLYRENVLGLQFHPEITEGALEDLIRNCGGELVPDNRDLSPEGAAVGPAYVGTAADLRAGLANAPAANAIMEKVCLRLESLAACT